MKKTNFPQILFLLIIAIFLDGLISLYVSEKSYFQPLLTITTIPIMANIFKKKKSLFYLLLVFYGFIYDIFYTTLMPYHSIIFIILGLFATALQKIIKHNALTTIMVTIFTIILYELTTSITISLHQGMFYVSQLTHKISHTLLLNIIYTNIIYKISIIEKK